MRFKGNNITYTTSEPVEGFSAIATYSAKDSDSGIGKLSSSSPWKCISIASWIFVSTLIRVEPVTTKPV